MPPPIIFSRQALEIQRADTDWRFAFGMVDVTADRNAARMNADMQRGENHQRYSPESKTQMLTEAASWCWVSDTKRTDEPLSHAADLHSSQGLCPHACAGSGEALARAEKTSLRKRSSWRRKQAAQRITLRHLDLDRTKRPAMRLSRSSRYARK